MNCAAQGRGWQGPITVKKVSLSKYTTPMGVLWPFGSFITIVNNLNRDKWLSAVDCLYSISSKGSVYPAYTSVQVWEGPLFISPIGRSSTPFVSGTLSFPISIFLSSCVPAVCPMGVFGNNGIPHFSLWLR